MNKLDYDQMKQIDIRTVDVNTLVDIEKIEIDKTLSKEERISDFIKKVKNPFCFKCNGMVVKTVYRESGENLEDKLVGLFVTMSGVM